MILILVSLLAIAHIESLVAMETYRSDDGIDNKENNNNIPNTLRSSTLYKWNNLINKNQDYNAVQKFVNLLIYSTIIDEEYEEIKTIYSIGFLESLNEYNEEHIDYLIEILNNSKVQSELGNMQFDASILYQQLIRATWHCNSCRDKYLNEIVNICSQNEKYCTDYFKLTKNVQQIINEQFIALHQKNYKFNLDKQSLKEWCKIICSPNGDKYLDKILKNNQKPNWYYYVIIDDNKHSIIQQIDIDTLVTRFINLSLKRQKTLKKQEDNIIFRDTFLNNLIDYYDINDLKLIIEILSSKVMQKKLQLVKTKSKIILKDLKDQINEMQKDKNFCNKEKEKENLLNEIVKLIAGTQQNNTSLKELEDKSKNKTLTNKSFTQFYDSINKNNNESNYEEIIKRQNNVNEFITMLEDPALLLNCFKKNNNKEEYYNFIYSLAHKKIKTALINHNNRERIISNIIDTLQSLDDKNNLYGMMKAEIIRILFE